MYTSFITLTFKLGIICVSKNVNKKGRNNERPQEI